MLVPVFTEVIKTVSPFVVLVRSWPTFNVPSLESDTYVSDSPSKPGADDIVDEYSEADVQDSVNRDDAPDPAPL